ncbi:MAG TPA: type II secretion system F family protein [Myxococcota bacterium]|nr:type II secretion system F family protein [Myxococcota bacterium]
MVVVAALTSAQILLILFIISTIVAAATFSIYSMAFPATTAADRLEALTMAAESGMSDLIAERQARAVEALAARLGRLAQTDDQDAAERMRRLLMYAGYKNRRALEVFNGVRVAGAVILPVVASLGLFQQETTVILFGMLLAAAMGYYMPIMILTGQAQTRQAELLRSYPDALDLMVSSVESGLSLDQAFRRVAQEMRTVSPSLSKEFAMVNSQVSAGIDRITALKRLEERTGVEEVRSFCNTLSQAERYGSSIAASLTLYSQVAREKRIARAEEKAGQVGSKLTVVMILFFLPVLMLVLLSPTAIRWLNGEGEEK